MNIYAENKIKTLIGFFVVILLIVGCSLGMSFRSYAEEKLSKPVATAETILDSQYSTWWEGNSSHNLISWDKVDGANMYYVYRRDNSKTKFSLLAKTTSVEYKDKNIKDNTTYYYIVKAVKLSNGKVVKKSNYSEVVHCITGLKRFPELTIYAMDDTNIAIGMRGSSADDYVIYYSDDKGENYKDIKLNDFSGEILKQDSTGLITLRGYILGDLKPNKTYYIKVQTVDIDNGKIIRKKGVSDIVQVKTMKSNETDDKYIRFSDGTYKSADIEAIYLETANNDDIEKLSKMKNLKEIYIELFRGSDLTPLSKLKNLESLKITPRKLLGYNSGELEMFYPSNSISDISPLKNLNKLKTIVINGGYISDLSPLKKLKNLESITFADNRISDLSPITELKKLEYADFSENKISDLSPLENITSLKRLNLSENKIKKLTSLGKLSSLETLELEGNNISNITSLKKLKKLVLLNVNNNNISDISALEKLGKLRYLYINNNKLSDIGSLKIIFEDYTTESVSDVYKLGEHYVTGMGYYSDTYPKFELEARNNKLSIKEKTELKKLVLLAVLD